MEPSMRTPEDILDDYLEGVGSTMVKSLTDAGYVIVPDVCKCGCATCDLGQCSPGCNHFPLRRKP
jgi:hypothetical protein